ncbi:hypothetical protein QUB19_05180 [Microcoleus sp. B4-C5]|uniref:hypothetical protein n=1 Tax=unclassified Microcoleus TaxID=2642155 RepID=UPI002FD49E2B
MFVELESTIVFYNQSAIALPLKKCDRPPLTLTNNKSDRPFGTIRKGDLLLFETKDRSPFLQHPR